MQRGDLWWANLPEPTGSTSGYRRPVLVIQADAFTRSRLATVIIVAITSNLRLATAPGNVFLPATESSLPKDSVINVSQIITLDKSMLDEYVDRISATTLSQVEEGLRLVLDV
ncbi:type II toxin-antitoxin system PemK/MazF family toxin [Candidatus Chloroploca sp. Khr17]|uniref:type II toxin-antitoxin system PemK/MazF family toxin n=1 Tax=Candidatus Chloroploca sp. Khr17 TaxID=2496869 RepID=UPI001F0E70A9|nr:type II toxin-antitoxin system PemK/MazF family toxin [Candidatus Chloroploca sp. Khr17]